MFEGAETHFRHQAYIHAIESAGLLPVIVPPLAEPGDLHRVIDAVSGLVLTGGEDVDPARARGSGAVAVRYGRRSTACMRTMSAGPGVSVTLSTSTRRGDSAGDWAAHGFVSDLRAAGLNFDVVATNATIGYYMKETIVERMRDDVLTPARQQGYKQIWIVGASMGGLGSLIVASRLPGAVAAATYRSST